MSFIQDIWDKIHSDDKGLAKAFFYLALISVALGGLMAIPLSASRAPALQSFVDSYYGIMTAHTTLIFMYGLSLFVIVILLSLGLGLLETKTRLIGNRLGWAAFVLIAVSLLFHIAAFLSGADTSYKAEPVVTGFQAVWLQHIGYILLSVGSIVIFVLFLFTILRRRGSKNLNHLAFATGITALLGIFGNVAILYTMARGAAGAFGLMEPVGTAEWSHIFHFFFHVIHYVPLIAMFLVCFIVAYQWNAPSVTGETFIRGVWASYLFLVPPTFLYHLLLDPSYPPLERAIGSVLALLVDVPAIVIVSIFLAMFVVVARSAGGRGLFGWLRKLPWGSPPFGSIIAAFIVMLVPAALAGGSLINARLESYLGSTFALPGYFHPVAGGVLMVSLGIAYYLMPLFTGRRLWGFRLAAWQPYILAGGYALFGLGGIVSGFLGLPRRFADITMGGSSPGWLPWMNLSAIGMAISLVGGILFILIMVMTALRGQKAEETRALFDGMQPTEEVELRHVPVSVAQVPSVVIVLFIWGLAILGFELMARFPIGG